MNMLLTSLPDSIWVGGHDTKGQVVSDEGSDHSFYKAVHHRSIDHVGFHPAHGFIVIGEDVNFCVGKGAIYPACP